MTGQFIFVPREPTKEMLRAAWADALGEDAAGVWRAMIEEYKKSIIEAQDTSQ